MSRLALAVPSLALLAAAAATAVPSATVLVPEPVLAPEIVHVAGPVHYLVNEGGNIGLSTGADGLLVVDSQFDRIAEENQAAIREVAGEGATARFLVNTHHHGDHVGGNAVLGAGGTILAHASVRTRMGAGAGLPVLTYEEGCSLHLNGEEVRLMHLPAGHTDGDTVVWFTGSNVVHMGDLLFSDRFPFIDLAAGGSVRGVLENVSRVLELVPEDAVFVAGHGPHVAREGVVLYRDMLLLVVDRVSKGMAEGMDAAAMVKAGLLDDLAETWEWDFVDRAKMIETAVESLGPR